MYVLHGLPCHWGNITLSTQNGEMISVNRGEHVALACGSKSGTGSFFKAFALEEKSCWTGIYIDKQLFKREALCIEPLSDELELRRPFIEKSDVLLIDAFEDDVTRLVELRAYEWLTRQLLGVTVVAPVSRLHLLTLFDLIYVLEPCEAQMSGTLAILPIARFG